MPTHAFGTNLHKPTLAEPCACQAARRAAPPGVRQPALNPPGTPHYRDVTAASGAMLRVLVLCAQPWPHSWQAPAMMYALRPFSSAPVFARSIVHSLAGSSTRSTAQGFVADGNKAYNIRDDAWRAQLALHAQCRGV